MQTWQNAMQILIWKKFMALVIDLKPNEKVIVGNAVITNDKQRTRLHIAGDAPILREKGKLQIDRLIFSRPMIRMNKIWFTVFHSNVICPEEFLFTKGQTTLNVCHLVWFDELNSVGLD